MLRGLSSPAGGYRALGTKNVQLQKLRCVLVVGFTRLALRVGNLAIPKLTVGITSKPDLA